VNVPVPVYGAVPPVAVTVTVVVPFEQRIAGPVTDEAATKAVGCVILPVVTEVQPLASVTV